MTEYRISVPVDLCITIKGDNEESAIETLREALDEICDGFDLPQEWFTKGDEPRIYGWSQDVDKAEIMDVYEEETCTES